MNNPIVKSFFDEDTNTISHVAYDLETKACAVIDPVLNFQASSGRTRTDSADQIINFVNGASLDVQLVIDTHVHADHLTAAPYIKQKCGGEILIGKHIDTVQKTFGALFNAGPEFKSDGSQFDHLVDHGEKLQLGKLTVAAIYTPGHTAACTSYLIGDALFVGDTLFMPDYGTARCDFPGGDAGTLYDSIQRLYALPDETRVFLCHDYMAPGRDEFVFETTIGRQKASNIHITPDTDRGSFVAMRTARDKKLQMPALILPAVQVNMRSGEMPSAEENGTIYLKIPVDAI